MALLNIIIYSYPLESVFFGSAVTCKIRKIEIRKGLHILAKIILINTLKVMRILLSY